MKRILYILIAVAVLASCSKHEDLDTLPEGGTHTPMTISVTDGGYASGDPKTRATENGYITQFTAGDQIGLYVVKPDGNYAQENVALTLTNNGSGTLAWTPPSGTTLYYEGAAAKYFAYYPYQTTLTGTLYPLASTTAADFFADVVTQWTPATDQSTHAKYTAQDLMTGSGTVSKQADAYTLGLTMTHAMALVVIETPKTEYMLSTDANYTWVAAAPDTRFYGFTPYSPSVGTYRLLVKPAQSGATDLMGSYTVADGSTQEYAIAQNNIAAANYHHYIVDKAIFIAKTHTLQPGDFYLKDGSLLGKGETLTEEQKAACVGIVLKGGKDDSGDRTDDCDYKLKDGTTSMTIIHGYVLALHDANDGSACEWGSSGTKVDHTDMNREPYIGFYGYKNTNAIKAFAIEKSMTLETAFPATYHATEGYEAAHPAPVNSSGWFLPSVVQCKYWVDNKDAILASVKKATGKPGYSWLDWYWSSSENDRNPASNAWIVIFSNGSVLNDNKSNRHYVRGVLAF